MGCRATEPSASEFGDEETRRESVGAAFATLVAAPADRPAREKGTNASDGNGGKKKRRIDSVRKQRIEKSVKNVMLELIKEGNTSVGVLCTTEAMRGIMDALDKNCERKLEKQVRREEKQRAVN